MNYSLSARSPWFCILFFLVLIVLGFVTGCGGGSYTAPLPTYTIGGTVSGLSGTGLVLQYNGGNNLSIRTNGTFTFATAITNGGSYNVTVLTQPTGPVQNCVVTNGSGTPSANVTTVQVTCTTITYTIGGTVTNLAGTGAGLELRNNGGDTLLVNANGPFTFATALTPGSAYSVTVFMQPSSPPQPCLLTNGTGTATANVTNVTVNCGHNEWTWVSGSNLASQKGTYGTLGMPALGNVPGARNGAVSWTDPTGNFWLFGGNISVGNELLNDLWKYSGAEWTWMGGSNMPSQQGTYGTKGIPAQGNVPGARQFAGSWTDKSGNFWLFGGFGYDSAGTVGDLNDLWKYNAGQWTWVGGSDVVNQVGTYGTQGTPAQGNIPGARDGCTTWTDAAGSLWLFGGSRFNDLWKYSAGQWTWVGGSNVASQKGTYGTQGMPAPGNGPGGRANAVNWIDAAGNFWLFGGFGYDSAGTVGDLNDLWEYSGGQWTWMGGSNIANQNGNTNPPNTLPPPDQPGWIPGARAYAIAWTDPAGNFWLFGGFGYAAEELLSGATILNDLWEYSGGHWTWMGGATDLNGFPIGGNWGTQGTASPSNYPGARNGAIAWIDASGNFWMFGGYGIDSTRTGGFLNDLWKYEP